MSNPRCPQCKAPAIATDNPAIWVCQNATDYQFTVSLDKNDVIKKYVIKGGKLVAEDQYKVIHVEGDHEPA